MLTHQNWQAKKGIDKIDETTMKIIITVVVRSLVSVETAIFTFLRSSCLFNASSSLSYQPNNTITQLQRKKYQNYHAFFIISLSVLSGIFFIRYFILRPKRSPLTKRSQSKWIQNRNSKYTFALAILTTDPREPSFPSFSNASLIEIELSFI